MSSRRLLHSDQTNDTAARWEPLRKPHVRFVSHDARQTRAHRLLAAMRARSIAARAVNP